MRAISPLGREVVCHIKSPFLLLLQVHSKHQDRGRDYAWQHYLQASRKIAVLLPISVTVIQVQPVLWDAWYIWPRGLLKQLGLTLLYCSFIVKFQSIVALLTLTCMGFLWRWLATLKGWKTQPGWCHARVRAPPVRERKRKVQTLHTSYENGRRFLAVSVNLMLLHKNPQYYYHKKFFFCVSLTIFESTQGQLHIQSPHLTHCTLLPVHTLSTSCLFSRIYSFIVCFFPSGSHRVEPVGGSGCGSSFALQDLNQWYQIRRRDRWTLN